MAWLATYAPYLQAAGTVLSVASNERGAASDSRQLNRLAGQERATSQRAASDERRRARLLESRARAIGAKSGAAASDPTVLNLMADLSAEGEYRALSRLYEGDTGASSLEQEGIQRQRTTRGNSISTILTGAATFASKYGD